MYEINPKKYILIPNQIIKKIDRLGGCDTFGLYINILLNKNWNNEIIVTPSILLYKLAKDKQYLTNLRKQLNTLIKENIINVDTDVTLVGLNKIIKISVLKTYGNHTEIKCVNSKILELDSLVGKNMLFTVFTYLKMATDKELNYALVSHKTISKTVGASIKTVHRAITVLDENGFITVTQGKYNSELRKNGANKYRVHNYGDTVYNSKLGLGTIPDKDNISSKNEEIIENKIAEVMDNPDKFSPCLITKFPAKTFLKIYSLNKDNLILTVESLKDMESIFNQYCGILDLPQKLFVLYFKTMNERIENYICAFIEHSAFPLVFLTGTEFNGPRIKGKLRYIIN